MTDTWPRFENSTDYFPTLLSHISQELTTAKTFSSTLEEGDRKMEESETGRNGSKSNSSMKHDMPSRSTFEIENKSFKDSYPPQQTTTVLSQSHLKEMMDYGKEKRSIK